jgi:amino acid transporter
MTEFNDKQKGTLVGVVAFFRRYKMHTYLLVAALVMLVVFCFIQSGALFYVHSHTTGVDNSDVTQKGLLGVGLTGFYVFIFAAVVGGLFVKKVLAKPGAVTVTKGEEEVVQEEPIEEYARVERPAISIAQRPRSQSLSGLDDSLYIPVSPLRRGAPTLTQRVSDGLFSAIGYDL